MPENISIATLSQEYSHKQSDLINSDDDDVLAPEQAGEKPTDNNVTTVEYRLETSSELISAPTLEVELKTQSISSTNDQRSIYLNDDFVNISLDQFNGTRWNCYWDDDAGVGLDDAEFCQAKHLFSTYSM